MSAAALLFATARAAEGGPAAMLALDGSTLVARLLDQLERLGVRRAWVLTRPQWADSVRGAVEGGALDAHVMESHDLAEDLRTAAAVAGRAGGPLLLGSADVLVHGEALALLLENPRVATGILVGTSHESGRLAFATASLRGRVVSAASAYHRVSAPDGCFLTFLKVDARDRPALAEAAGELAGLVGDGARPAGWDAELERKAAEWRVDSWRAAVGLRTGELPPVDDAAGRGSIELDPESEQELALRLAAAREEALALLLVGLVRSGVHVGQTNVRGFFYARALSRPALERAAAEEAGYDEDGVALASAVKATDGFFTTFFVSPYSRYIARFAARRGWTPNAITTVSMAVGALAAAAFAVGTRAGLIAGALLLQAAFTLDCVDGQLARYTRTFSRLGAWLDSVFDRGKEYLVYAGLAIGAARGYGQHVWTLAAAALTLQTVRHMIDFAFVATRHAAIAATPRVPLQSVDDGRLAAAAPAAAGRGVAGDPGGLAARLVAAVSRLDRWPAAVWAKRIVVLPIGERFALISATAALATPRVAFIALLAWGGVAAAYSVPGRILRSVAR